MTRFFFVLFAVLTTAFSFGGPSHQLARSMPIEQNHPNPDGEPPAYPDGQYCTPRGDEYRGQIVNGHQCACKRMTADPLCEGEASHDRDCLQWCHEDKGSHCHCPVQCAMPDDPDAKRGQS